MFNAFVFSATGLWGFAIHFKSHQQPQTVKLLVSVASPAQVQLMQGLCLGWGWIRSNPRHKSTDSHCSYPKFHIFHKYFQICYLTIIVFWSPEMVVFDTFVQFCSSVVWRVFADFSVCHSWKCCLLFCICNIFCFGYF